MVENGYSSPGNSDKKLEGYDRLEDEFESAASDASSGTIALDVTDAPEPAPAPGSKKDGKPEKGPSIMREMGRQLEGFVRGTPKSCPVKIIGKKPWNAVCQLECYTSSSADTSSVPNWYGTGFLIARNVVVTAAHNLMAVDGREARTIAVNSGRNGSSTVGRQIVRTGSGRWHVDNYWRDHHKHADSETFYHDKLIEHDYAVILLPDYFSAKIGYFKLVDRDDAYIGSYGGKKCKWGKPCKSGSKQSGRCRWFISGYPYVKGSNSKNGKNMWSAQGKIFVDSTAIKYEPLNSMLMQPGQSGGPVFGYIKNFAGIFGIHTSLSIGSRHGRACRITREVKSQIELWISPAIS